jgi:hypothetical protein
VYILILGFYYAADYSCIVDLEGVAYSLWCILSLANMWMHVSVPCRVGRDSWYQSLGFDRGPDTNMEGALYFCCCIILIHISITFGFDSFPLIHVNRYLSIP